MTPEELMAAVLACWCDLLASTTDGAPASCCWVAGTPAVADCCASFAWVRMVNSYPTEFFPQPYNQAKKCPALTWAIVVEVGVTRCAANPSNCDDPNGNPCCDAEEAVAAALFSDFQAARRLFSCGCIGLASDQIIPGRVQTYGPEGGCVGITAQATFQVTA